MKKARAFRAVLAIIVFALLVTHAARWLVIDDPQKADAILVLGGETNYRPARGLELLSLGYASRLVLDVPARDRVYQWTATELAEQWVKSLPQAPQITVCPVRGLSTSDEAREADACLKPLGVHSVLLVTSDFHCRRALSIFRRQFPGLNVSVAAVYDPTEFGFPWWKHREWAKNTLYEWMRLFWWDLIDRWR
jgi:uncharacterized SAM-binding protein YcdF (DUF218 family)